MAGILTYKAEILQRLLTVAVQRQICTALSPLLVMNDISSQPSLGLLQVIAKHNTDGVDRQQRLFCYRMKK
jgi:hypothetical protein